jgi:hypothetical protein
MANAVYPKALKKFLDADIDMLVDDIKVMMVDTDDDSYSAADEFLSDILAAARVGASANLANKATTSGVFDADSAIWASVTGDPTEAVVIYKDTGDPATSPLIVWMDTFDSGFPFTPNGGGFTLNWNALGIFSI